MAKLMWRVRLVAELEPGAIVETELARIERDQRASLAELGLRLDEAKQLTAASQAQLVPAQVAVLGRSCPSSEACGRLLVSKGHWTQHASMVPNKTLRVGTEVVQAATHAAATTDQPAAPNSGPVVVGLDGGYVRSRHRGEGRHFEIVVGKVIHADGAQHRFAFTRTGPAATTTETFRVALAVAGVGANTPTTELRDGDAGLWRLQRKVLPGAAVVLDWWHAAVRFEHTLQAARSLGTDTANNAHLADTVVRSLDPAEWRLTGRTRPRYWSVNPIDCAGRPLWPLSDDAVRY